MSPFDLEASVRRAEERFGPSPALPGRRPRSDRGASRLDPRAIDCVARSAAGQERPPMREMLREIRECCRARGLRPPSRATVYKLLVALPGPSCRVADLPPPVRDALYNLTPESLVPGRQVAFYCANYGDLRAMSFAAGLPWLPLYQALRTPGHRRKSRGLLEAVAAARGI